MNKNAAGIFRKRKEYKPFNYYEGKYSDSSHNMQNARKNGLPFKKIKCRYYYNEQDYNDYYAGRIGNA